MTATPSLVFTNRNIQADGTFGKGFHNSEDPSEYHAVIPQRKVNGRWTYRTLADTEIDGVVERSLRTYQRAVVVTHGYNNDFGDALDLCDTMKQKYPGECIIGFSWPSDGLGSAYLSDKEEARKSSPALGEVLKRIDSVVERANLRDTTTICGLFHSMGNYVFKHAIAGVYFNFDYVPVTQRLFDRIILMAADVNSPHHKAWLRRVSEGLRDRVYVFLNRFDRPLMISWLLPGGQQLDRLGRCEENMDCPNTVYVNTTSLWYMGWLHTYFTGEVQRIVDIVSCIFQGGDISTTRLVRSAGDAVYWPRY